MYIARGNLEFEPDLQEDYLSTIGSYAGPGAYPFVEADEEGWGWEGELADTRVVSSPAFHLAPETFWERWRGRRLPGLHRHRSIPVF